ncbi:MAG: hypothetical protein NTV51_08520, partial [Verrucomicrobia bacterium]|nr:hypothetical protein [Verrucomicrobiota bacterium]
MKTQYRSVGIIAAFCAGVIAASAAENARMLHDLSHGQSSLITREPMQLLVKKIGVDLAESNSPLTVDALAGVRVLYIRVPQKVFTAEEKAAVVGFVRKGGSLLLVVDEESRPGAPKAPEGINDLIVPFGLKLTPDTSYLHNCGGIVKAGAINRADREIP